jgi:hypothetical protein
MAMMYIYRTIRAIAHTEKIKVAQLNTQAVYGAIRYATYLGTRSFQNFLKETAENGRCRF